MANKKVNKSNEEVRVRKPPVDPKTVVIRFRELYQEYMMLSGCAESTRKAYRTMTVHLEKFCLDQYDEVNMYVEDFDLKFITRFHLWLQKQHPKARTTKVIHKRYKEFISPVHVKLQLKLLRAVIHFAERRGYLDHYPFKNFDDRISTAMKHGADMLDRKLSRNNLRIIENVNPGPKVLAHTRLLFLVQRWTGMAWADMHRYRNIKNQIKHNLDHDRMVITYNRVKTKELAIVPLLPETIVILEKLNYDIFPGAYVSYYRRILRLFAFFDLPSTGLGTHTGRHVFGSEMLEMGFPMEAVSRMMGHSTITETESVYARINQDKIFADLGRIEKKKIAVTIFKNSMTSEEYAQQHQQFPEPPTKPQPIEEPIIVRGVKTYDGQILPQTEYL